MAPLSKNSPGLIWLLNMHLCNNSLKIDKIFQTQLTTFPSCHQTFTTQKALCYYFVIFPSINNFVGLNSGTLCTNDLKHLPVWLFWRWIYLSVLQIVSFWSWVDMLCGLGDLLFQFSLFVLNFHCGNDYWWGGFHTSPWALALLHNLVSFHVSCT